MENFTVAPYKRIPIPASGKFLLVESGRIQETFSCGIRNPGLWNPECSSRNPESGIAGLPRIIKLLRRLFKMYVEYIPLKKFVLVRRELAVTETVATVFLSTQSTH